jgi:hypothetical protein
VIYVEKDVKEPVTIITKEKPNITEVHHLIRVTAILAIWEISAVHRTVLRMF